MWRQPSGLACGSYRHTYAPAHILSIRGNLPPSRTFWTQAAIRALFFVFGDCWYTQVPSMSTPYRLQPWPLFSQKPPICSGSLSIVPCTLMLCPWGGDDECFHFFLQIPLDNLRDFPVDGAASPLHDGDSLAIGSFGINPYQQARWGCEWLRFGAWSRQLSPPTVHQDRATLDRVGCSQLR